MPYEDWVRRIAAVRKANSLYYHYRTRRWRWHPAFRRAHGDQPEIDRPVFLLGTQGGGLTILSRILRRIPEVVSATGNARYWAGYDEMQDVLYDLLPEDLRLQPLQLPGRTQPSRDWLYASDRFFEQYHRTSAHASPELEDRFRRALRGLIRMNAPPGLATPRLVDKSQSFTVRVGLVGALLRDRRPKFVLITRDPFAMCWRAVRKVASYRDLDATESEKLSLAVQHWRNSMSTVMEEGGEWDLSWWRFEDFLEDPERVVREICRFAELPYSPDILPGPDDRIPWGSMWDAFDRSKWYPIRKPVNDAYLEELPTWAVDTIVSGCEPFLERFGYGFERKPFANEQLRVARADDRS